VWTKRDCPWFSRSQESAEPHRTGDEKHLTAGLAIFHRNSVSVLPPIYIFLWPPHFPCLYVYFFSSCLLFGGFPYIFFERGVHIFLLVLFVPFFLNNRGSPPLIRLPSKVCYENKCVFSMLSVSFFIFVFVSFSLFFYVCVFFSCFFLCESPWNFSGIFFGVFAFYLNPETMKLSILIRDVVVLCGALKEIYVDLSLG